MLTEVTKCNSELTMVRFGIVLNLVAVSWRFGRIKSASKNVETTFTVTALDQHQPSNAVPGTPNHVAGGHVLVVSFPSSTAKSCIKTPAFSITASSLSSFFAREAKALTLL